MTISAELEKAIATAKDRQIYCPSSKFKWDGKEGKLEDERIDRVSFLPKGRVEIYLKW